LTPPAKPLPFWDEWHTVALLMYSQVAAVAKDNRVGVFAVAVVTDGTLSILLFALAGWLTVHCGSTTRAWTMCLGRLRIWLWDTCKMH
jgi:hypothetical protein